MKTAKRLQEGQKGNLDPAEDINDITDEMVLKAFRIVTKGVRFVDALEDDKRTRVPSAITIMATLVEESHVPPTPPADQDTFCERTHEKMDTIAEEDANAIADEPTPINAALSDSCYVANAFPLPGGQQVAPLASPTNTAPHRWSLNSKQTNRLSSSISHRLSVTGSHLCPPSEHLTSERLNLKHDLFLSHLGSFIGRLHLGSQSRPELALAIKQSAASGSELLIVVDAVCGHSSSYFETLELYRAALFDQIQLFVFSARDVFNQANAEEDLLLPSDKDTLLLSSTACVRSAGECVATAKTCIERLGDFEMQFESYDIGLDLSDLDSILFEQNEVNVATFVPSQSSSEAATADSDQSEVGETPYSHSVRTSNSSISMSRRGLTMATDKPLPEVPQVTTPTQEAQHMPPVLPSALDESDNPDSTHIATLPSLSSARGLGPLPKISTSLQSSNRLSVPESIGTDAECPSRFDSLAASSAGSSATYLSRDSETSVMSQTSTRATTPDNHGQPNSQAIASELSATNGAGSVDEVDEVESRLLEKTFAHELMFNKEGQVTAGSLPALVERLTTHEATPDATFVSTFYLTFRLFCTPVKMAESLIERFNYVGESVNTSSPVRLRVYNVFKGWLESHWRDATDREALKLILPFAEHRLAMVLPSAGRRLLELAQRVSGDGSLVPRLVSSMGKTNTSIAVYVPAETPLPQPLINKSQHNLLTSAKLGGSAPSILDFEPLEIARQLTIKQIGIFCSILPEELLASQWTKNNGINAPNVKAMSSFSTDLSNLVAGTILQHQELKKRASVIKHWIKIAHQCHELHNYDGLMAIVCSLNSSTITRLRKTWDAVSVKRRETLRALREIVEPSEMNKNNKILRTRLHDHIPPCLPFLGMYLTDLTFVDIGNSSTKQMTHGCGSADRAGGLTVVNFDKHTRTAKIIGELQRFQIPYRLTELPDMQEWISTQIRRIRDADQGNVQHTYWRKSLLLEPRENAALRAAAEPSTPTITGAGGSRDNLFAWMSRDRGTSSTQAV